MSDQQPGFENPARTPIALKTSAPRAWRNLMRTVIETAPRDLSAVARVRARMLRR